jgi:WD40 repeat protein
MRKLPTLLLLLAFLLNGCSALPVSLDFLATKTPPPPTLLITKTATATFVPLPTRTATATLTLAPTRRSPYPVYVGTPLPDLGFPPIGTGNTPLIKPVFSNVAIRRQAVAISANHEKILIASTNGLFLFDRQANQLGYWPDLQLLDIPCSACISMNEEGNRFVILLSVNSAWEAHVYDILDGQLSLYKKIDFPEPYRSAASPIQLALSTDGFTLAYTLGDDFLIVYDMAIEQKILEYKGRVKSFRFSNYGSIFFVQRGNELLMWSANNWDYDFQNLLLPNDSAPFEISVDGAYLIVALSSKIRIYNAIPLRLVREINIEPTSATNRYWQIELTSNNDGENILRGYGLQWDAAKQTGLVTLIELNLSVAQIPDQQQIETTSANAFDTFWNIKFTETSLFGDLDPGQYFALRFINNENLLVNGLHAACWLKLPTGETNCLADSTALVRATDGLAFREIRSEDATLLQTWNSAENIFSLDPHPIVWLNRSADLLLLDNNAATIDLYNKVDPRPVQSVPGRFLAAAENSANLAFITAETPELFSLTMIDKSTQTMLFQKREARLFAPIVITLNGSTYYLKEDRADQKIIVFVIPPGTDTIFELGRIEFSSIPTSLAVSINGVVAIGLQDGNIIIVSPDGFTNASFLAMHSAVTQLAFSPDGRYLAATGRNAIKVFAVIPQ